MRRVLAALLVAAAALSLLTACGPPIGADAEKWLLTSEIVESVDTSGHYDGFTFIPSVTAVLDGDASDAEVRELTLATSDYLLGDGRGNLSIRLSIDPFHLDVPAVERDAETAVRLWATARADDRVTSGRFSGTEATIGVTRADIGTAFAQYAPGLQLLTVHSDEHDEYDAAFQLSGTAECVAAGESSIAALFADEAVIGARLDACVSGRVATTAAALLPTAERLAADLAAAPFAITVVSAAGSDWTTRASREVPLELVTPEMLGLLRTVEVRDPIAMRVDAENGLEVEVEPRDLQSAAASILLDPGFAAAASVVLRTEGITVWCESITETPAVLDLAEGFVDLGLANSFFFARDGEVRFSLGASQYTEENARRVVDLALSNAVWETSTVYIGDTQENGAVFDSGDPDSTEGELAEATVTYWLSAI